MPSLEKKVMIRELNKKIEARPYLFFASFRKLSTGDMSALRRNLQKSADSCVVIKNTLAIKIFDQLGIKDASKFIEGQTFVATCKEEPQKLSKVLVDFAKEKEEAFKIKGAFVEGQSFESAYVRELSKLPGKHELLTKVAIGVKSPITGFVLTLNGIVRSLVIVVNQIALKKSEPQAPAPVEAPAQS
ncbi:MAG: 50S ribosomal protein L10 [Candidatus Omnitrophica bacterium]|nr:50S ribosomal protein L10 [Candidatus Omnitrophota bacterium]